MIPGRSFEDLPRATRRQLIRRALLRPTLTTATLIILYFSIPLDRGSSPGDLAALFLGLGIFVALIVLQTRAIMRSPYPRLTAITALAFSIPLFVLSFSIAYYLMERSVPHAFTEPMTRLDALYFTVTVLSTVGFGDIAASSEAARAATTVQMVADLLLIGLVVRVMLNAVQTGLSRHAQTAAAGASQPDESDTD